LIKFTRLNFPFASLSTLKRARKEIAIVLETPEIRELQRKLYQKAKQEL
jgi:hypothetical protein